MTVVFGLSAGTVWPMRDASVGSPCRVVAHAPVQVGGAPAKTIATVTFTCAARRSQATATAQSQQQIRGRWIHQATRTVTFFQVKAKHRYTIKTPPITCSVGQSRTIASVRSGGPTSTAQSPAVAIGCI